METTDLEFRMMLALEMGRTPRELDQILTPGEWREWRVYFKRKAARRDMEDKRTRQAARRRGRRR